MSCAMATSRLVDQRSMFVLKGGQMANHQVIVNLSFDSEGGAYLSLDPLSINLAQGDTVEWNFRTSPPIV